MSVELHNADDVLPLRITRQIDALCDEFEAALRRGGGVAIEPYVGRVETPGREPLVKELMSLALGQLREKVRQTLSRISWRRIQPCARSWNGYRKPRRYADGTR